MPINDEQRDATTMRSQEDEDRRGCHAPWPHLPAQVMCVACAWCCIAAHEPHKVCDECRDVE